MIQQRPITAPIPPRPLKTRPENFRSPSELKASLKEEEERVAKALLGPDTFATYFLQADVWDLQQQILQAVATNPRVAVKACHASGKTFTAAQAVLWFLARYPEVVIVTTAPTWVQVEKLLWGEVHSALIKSRYPFPKATNTELWIGPKRYAYGLSTSVTKQDEGVKFQGIHADRVLVIMDEAPGVDPKIWEAIEGARAGGNVAVLAIGNPTIASGPFHSAFTKDRSGWVCFTIDAFDTPNLKNLPGLQDGKLIEAKVATAEQKLQYLLKCPEDELDQNVCSYLTTRRWVKEKYYEWGPIHPSWQSRVRGQFPKQSEDSLMNLTWLEEAATRELDSSAGDLIAGLDVAGPGEAETVLTLRKGPEILWTKAWAQSDPRGEVVQALTPHKNQLKAVNVDSIGIGWGMYEHLLDLKFPAIPINVSESSGDSEKYANQKAEFYWGLRMRCEAGHISGAISEKAIGQLAGIRYKHNPRGQVLIESKEDAAKRGVASPDHAESIMLAFADRIAVYGVLEYYKTMKQEMEKVSTSRMMKPGMTDNQMSCPACQAVCVVRVGSGYRCNQCGDQWADPSDKRSLQLNPSRRDLLAKGQITKVSTRG